MSGTRTRRPRQQDSGRNDQDPGDNAPPSPAGGGPFPQDPTACLRPDPAASRLRSTHHPARRRGVQYWEPADSGPAELVSVPPSSTTPHTRRPPGLGGAITGAGAALHRQTPSRARSAGEVLLRKEVIQPHLPVRLPCYDFVPIADPAFD